MRMAAKIDEIDAMVLFDLVGDCDLHIPREGNSSAELYAAFAEAGEEIEAVTSRPVSAPASTAIWERDSAALKAQLPEETRAAIDRHEAAGTFDSPEYRDAMREYYERTAPPRRMRSFLISVRSMRRVEPVVSQTASISSQPDRVRVAGRMRACQE